MTRSQVLPGYIAEEQACEDCTTVVQRRNPVEEACYAI
jgi:hypothetical protein